MTKLTLFTIAVGLFTHGVESFYGSSRGGRGGTGVAFVPHQQHKLRPPSINSIASNAKTTLLSDTKNVLEKSSIASSTDPWSAENVNKCADLWHLSPEQTEKLEGLHASLQDIQHAKNNPYELARYLHEFKFDLDKAETKFRSMIKWRMTQNVDQVLTGYHPPPLYRYFPAGVLQGLDRDGDPIHVERTGAADSIGLLKRYGREEMLQQAIWLREVQAQGQWQQDYQDQQGHPFKQFTIIMDMKGLSTKHMNPSLLGVGQQVSRIVQDNFPGCAKRIIIIRANPIFKLAFKAFKPFIDESMREKIIVTSGEKEHLKVLPQYMELDLLPPEIYPQGHGQAVADFDTVWRGGKIPDEEEEEVPIPLEEVAVPAVVNQETLPPPVLEAPPAPAEPCPEFERTPVLTTSPTWKTRTTKKLVHFAAWVKRQFHRVEHALLPQPSLFLDNFAF